MTLLLRVVGNLMRNIFQITREPYRGVEVIMGEYIFGTLFIVGIIFIFIGGIFSGKNQFREKYCIAHYEKYEDVDKCKKRYYPWENLNDQNR